MPQNQAFRASKGASGFSRPRIPGRKGVNGFSPAKRCTEEASSAIPLRNAITEVRPRPIIPHAIPTQPNPVSTQNPQNSNDQTSDHETRPRELHAKLLGRRGLAGLRDNAPSEARGADGSRAGRHPPAHTATRHHWCGGRRRDRRARAGFEIDHSEPSGSRVAISRAAGPDGARNTRGATSNTSRKAAAHGHTKQPGPTTHHAAPGTPAAPQATQHRGAGPQARAPGATTQTRMLRSTDVPSRSARAARRWRRSSRSPRLRRRAGPRR